MKVANIEKALVTGKVLVKIRQKIDNLIGSAFRYFWAKRQKIQKNKIVFMTFSGKYDCNLKYIAEEILRQEMPYELIWLTTSNVKKMQKAMQGITVVKKSSYMGLYHIATAKIWLDNALNLLWYPSIPKKKDQIYINTWHGSMGLKRIGGQDVQNRAWKNVAKKCNRVTNYCISNSTFETKIFRMTHWPDVSILEYGHARNDILFRLEEQERKAIKSMVLENLKLIPRISENMEYLYPKFQEQIMKNREEMMAQKFVLYAPTFRDNGKLDCYNIDFMQLIDALQKRFGGTWRILLRFHYHNRNVGQKIKNEKMFINVTDYPDMQELLAIADVGITDYSSWICDYALTGRPAFLYATDIADYNNERGLYYPLETTPFPVATNNDELIEKIEGFDEDEFEKKRIAFLKDKGCIEDGHAAERVVGLIKEIIDGSK